MTMVLDVETIAPNDAQVPTGKLWELAVAAGVYEHATLPDDPDDEIPQMDARMLKHAATCAPLARVVVVAMLHVETNRAFVGYDASAFRVVPCRTTDDLLDTNLEAVAFNGYDNEADLMGAVMAHLGTQAARAIVTFNGRCFDVPVLMLAAARNKVGVPEQFVSMAYASRYRWPVAHEDVSDQLTLLGAGRRTSLRAYCLGLGLGDPKELVSGADVADLVAKGAARDAGAYCLSDCRWTLRVQELWNKSVRR